MRQFVNEDAKAFSLDSQSRVPLFRQLADELRRRIADGMYKAGDVLPGIHELARMYHASEEVPRRALELLAAEGLTRPCRGVGSTVAKSALEKSASAKESVSPPADGGVLLYAPMPGWSCSSVEEIYNINRLLLDEGHRVTILTSAGSFSDSKCVKPGIGFPKADYNWESGAKVKVSVGDGRWTAVVEIPKSALGEIAPRFPAEFLRTRNVSGEVTSYFNWSPYSRGIDELENMGTLVMPR